MKTSTQPSLLSRAQQLSDAALRLTADHDLSRILQSIVDSASEVTGAKYAALGVLDPTRTRLVQFNVSGISERDRQKIGNPPVGHGILGLLIKDPRPIRIKDLNDHPDSQGFPQHHPPMKSFLGVPIMGRSGAIGNLYLTEKVGSEEFSAEDEAFTVMFAAHAAVAIENARLFQETHRLLDQLKQLQESRERMRAMISHELRNSLTAAYGWMDLLMRRLEDPPPRAATEVLDCTERTLALLEDLLDLSRIDAERFRLSVRKCDARQLIREAVRTVEPQAHKNRIALSTNGTSQSVKCRTDPQRVRQVLVNLLSNAVRHSPEGSTVRVDLQPSEVRLRFQVIDEGEGIPAQKLPGIFDEYVKGEREDGRGTGLGLHLSKRLASMLGGDLTVASSLGEGSVFTLDIARELTDRP